MLKIKDHSVDKSVVTHGVEGARELCGISFIRTAIPVMRAHELMVSQRPHLLTPSHQALEFQHTNFRETHLDYCIFDGELWDI